MESHISQYGNPNKSIWQPEDRISQIKEWLDSFKNCRILEIGIGEGHLFDYLSRNNTIIGLDLNIRLFSKLRMKRATTNLAVEDGCYVLSDGRSLPFRDGVFDLVVCREVVEHMPIGDARKMLRNIDDVLSSKGTLILSTPNRLSVEGLLGSIGYRLSGGKWNAWDISHKHIYDFYEFRALLKNSSFILDSVRGEYFIFAALSLAKGITPLVKRIRIVTDRVFGRSELLSRYGFVLEYRLTKAD